MDKMMTRFKYCDARLYPFLEKVLDRLPAEVNEDILNDRGFQILADEGVLGHCGLRYEFDEPVVTLVYFNTKILLKPEHWIIYKMAKQMAQYVLYKNGEGFSEQDMDGMLESWGFKKEVDAVRRDKVIAESAGYNAGYNWAKKQNSDYLLQHFGLYFDQWNEKGLECLLKEEFELPSNLPGADTIHDDRVQLYKIELDSHGQDKVLRVVSLRGAMLTGIMTAVKELKMRDLYGPNDCIDHQSRYMNVT